MKDEFKINLDNLRETEKLAQKIAKRLKPKSFISLRGKLGVGKTTLASFIINNLSKKKIRVPSPTFSIVNIYDLKNIKVWHYDLFRLSNKKEIFINLSKFFESLSNINTFVLFSCLIKKYFLSEASPAKNRKLSNFIFL